MKNSIVLASLHSNEMHQHNTILYAPRFTWGHTLQPLIQQYWLGRLYQCMPINIENDWIASSSSVMSIAVTQANTAAGTS